MKKNEHNQVLVVDYGGTEAQQVARDVREQGVFSLVFPPVTAAGRIGQQAQGAVILVGADSAQEEDMRLVCDSANVPVWSYSEEGLVDFLFGQANLEPTWRPEAMVELLTEQVRQQVGDSKVLLALSGGVDSSVAAALIHRAVGEQLTCVFVDHGLLREGEREQVEQDLAQALGINLITVDASDRFLGALAGVSDPEQKRKIIGNEFIRVFEQVAKQITQEAEAAGEEVGFLAQGTLYPDIVESGGVEGVKNIKSHHNVGGLPPDLDFALVEPLATLFKDEVREIGRTLGLEERVVDRQPFPGPGLGVRIVGEVTAQRAELLRKADAIVREELTAAGLDDQIWQAPVVLLADVRSVGTDGHERTYGHPIVLRPVASQDAMVADWVYLPQDVLARISTRITTEVPQVNRVVLDVTGKPPGTIEWE